MSAFKYFNWHPSKGDYIKTNSLEEAELVRRKRRKEILLLTLLSVSTVLLFILSIFFFSL